jgi:hypothetical protein
VKAKRGGVGSFQWRTKEQKDFSKENSVEFTWPTSAEWQTIKTELPVKGRLIHLRITTPKEMDGFELQSITITPQQGDPVVFEFHEVRSKQ